MGRRKKTRFRRAQDVLDEELADRTQVEALREALGALGARADYDTLAHALHAAPDPASALSLAVQLLTADDAPAAPTYASMAAASAAPASPDSPDAGLQRVLAVLGPDVDRDIAGELLLANGGDVDAAVAAAQALAGPTAPAPAPPPAPAPAPAPAGPGEVARLLCEELGVDPNVMQHLLDAHEGDPEAAVAAVKGLLREELRAEAEEGKRALEAAMHFSDQPPPPAPPALAASGGSVWSADTDRRMLRDVFPHVPAAEVAAQYERLGGDFDATVDYFTELDFADEFASGSHLDDALSEASGAGSAVQRLSMMFPFADAALVLEVFYDSGENIDEAANTLAVLESGDDAPPPSSRGMWATMQYGAAVSGNPNIGRPSLAEQTSSDFPALPSSAGPATAAATAPAPAWGQQDGAFRRHVRLGVLERRFPTVDPAVLADVLAANGGRFGAAEAQLHTMFPAQLVRQPSLEERRQLSLARESSLQRAARLADAEFRERAQAAQDDYNARAAARVRFEARRDDAAAAGGGGSRAAQFRAEASEHGERMRSMLSQVREAYRKFGGEAAAGFAEEARRQRRLMQDAHQRAATEEFRAHNGDLGRGGTVDLHGLFVREALAVVERSLAVTRGRLDIITGVGKHSGRGGPRIKPAVERMLRARGLPFTSEGGKVVVTHR